MSGDISRDTFRKEKHYESVRLQQGRALLDADFNEQCEITSHRNEQEVIDVVGSCGAPFHRSGFRIVKNKTDLTEKEKGKWKNGSLECTAPDFIITAGQYYVDGILCENDFNILFSGQPNYPNPQPVEEGLNLAYLDCWKRSITSVEDPHIREVALGGPDTATRLLTVWQVKTILLPNDVKTDFTCFQDQWEQIKTKYIFPESQGGLKAKVAEESPSTEACSDIAPGGYSGLGNQLYRVHIHKTGKAGNGATFIWSRENASVCASCEISTADDIVVLKNTPKEKIEKFSNGKFIEITDDSHELKGLPGQLVKIIKPPVNNDLTLKISVPVIWSDFRNNPKVRLWDHADTTIYVDTRGERHTLPLDAPGNDIPIQGDDRWYELEKGILVCFEKDKEYHTGDCWMIPVRSITRSIEWPVDEDAIPEIIRPQGPVHHYCPLAILDYSSESFTDISDRRCVFHPLTELNHFFYVGGDGQEILWNPVNKELRDVTVPYIVSSQIQFSQPLMVGVTNHHMPVEGVTIQYKVLSGPGVFQGNKEEIKIKTREDGIASCTLWVDGDEFLSGKEDFRRIRSRNTIVVAAQLLDEKIPSVHPPIYFTATILTVNASIVTYNPGNCPILSGVETVQEAIDKLCSLWIEAHNDCTLKVVSQGNEVFIGEEGLDITTAVGNATQLAWFASGTSPATDAPGYILNINPPKNYYVAPDIFAGKTGTWYRWIGGNQGIAFEVVDPVVKIRICDQNTKKDVTGKSVPPNSVLNFLIETNIYTIIQQRCGDKPVPGFVTIRVRAEKGRTIAALPTLATTFTTLQMPDGSQKALTGLAVDGETWFWVAKGDKNQGWATGALDSSGSRMYPAGTYLIRAELDLNRIRDNYKAPDGSDYTGKTVTAIATITLTDKVKESSVIVHVSSSTISSGDTIRISGSADAEKVFLSISDADTREKRSKLTALTVKTVDGNSTTFTGVDVGRDRTWEYTWDTSKLKKKLEPGKYLIHVTTSPNVQDSVEKGEYGTILVELKR
jgi:hypothetical protein